MHRRLVNASRVTEPDPVSHRHLLGVGVTEIDLAPNLASSALTVGNIGQDGEICSFGPPSDGVKRCGAPVLAVLPAEIESKLPDGGQARGGSPA